MVQVIAAYNASGADQLTLEKGQLIQVLKKTDTGWWQGQCQIKGQGKVVGWFPSSFVKPIGANPSGTSAS